MIKYIYGRSHQLGDLYVSHLQWFSISMGGATRGKTRMSSYLQWLSISMGGATRGETGMSSYLQWLSISMGGATRGETGMSSYLQWFSISMGGATRGETGMFSYLQWFSVSMGGATRGGQVCPVACNDLVYLWEEPPEERPVCPVICNDLVYLWEEPPEGRPVCPVICNDLVYLWEEPPEGRPVCPVICNDLVYLWEQVEKRLCWKQIVCPSSRRYVRFFFIWPSMAGSTNCGQDPSWHYTQCGSAILVISMACLCRRLVDANRYQIRNKRLEAISNFVFVSRLWL